MLALTTSESSVQQVLERAARNAARLTSATRASIAVPSGTGGLRFAAEWDASDQRPLVSGREIAAGPGSVAGEVLAGREPRHVSGERLLAELSGGGAAPAPRLAARMLLMLPMVANEQVEGVLTVSRPRRKQRFSKHDVTVAAAIADHAALAIQGARAIERERRERCREQLLARVVTMGLRPASPAQVARQAAPLIMQAVGGDWLMVLLRGADGGPVDRVIAEPEQLDPGPAALARAAVGRMPRNVPLVGAAAVLDFPLAVTAEPALVARSDLMAGAEELRGSWSQSSVRSWASVAVVAGPDDAGLLAVGRREAAAFPRADLDFLRTAARSLAMAIRCAAELAGR
jgi:GAF domain-containing protein